MTAARLREIVGRFPACRVAVLGDFFLDKYLDTDPGLAEISVETREDRPPGRVHPDESRRGRHDRQQPRLARGGGGPRARGQGGRRRGVRPRKGPGRPRLRDRGSHGRSGPLHPDLPQAEGPAGRPASPASTTATTPRTGGRCRARRRTRSSTASSVLLPRVDAVAVEDQVDEEDCGVVTTRVRERLAELGRLHPEKVIWADSRVADRPLPERHHQGQRARGAQAGLPARSRRAGR